MLLTGSGGGAYLTGDGDEYVYGTLSYYGDCGNENSKRSLFACLAYACLSLNSSSFESFGGATSVFVGVAF